MNDNNLRDHMNNNNNCNSIIYVQTAKHAHKTNSFD